MLCCMLCVRGVLLANTHTHTGTPTTVEQQLQDNAHGNDNNSEEVNILCTLSIV